MASDLLTDLFADRFYVVVLFLSNFSYQSCAADYIGQLSGQRFNALSSLIDLIDWLIDWLILCSRTTTPTIRNYFYITYRVAGDFLPAVSSVSRSVHMRFAAFFFSLRWLLLIAGKHNCAVKHCIVCLGPVSLSWFEVVWCSNLGIDDQTISTMTSVHCCSANYCIIFIATSNLSRSQLAYFSTKFSQQLEAQSGRVWLLLVS